MNKDYYGILGIEKDATETEIKNAYRKLAAKYHPDVSTDPQANEKMASINEAYSVLKDPKKRAEYDQYGNLNETANTYNYNPDSRMYDYNSGYVFIKRPFSIFRMLFFLLVLIPIIRLIIYSLSQGMSNYNFDYQSTSSITMEVTGINYNSFYYSRGIDIEIPKSKRYGLFNMEVNGIGENAFKNNEYIESITIYNTIDYIDSYAFYNCTNLETIYFYGTEDEFNSITIEDGNDSFINAKVIYYNAK